MQLAHQLGGEIILVDSMQVYQGLDIGTAKPSREEREQICHHLIDILSLHESFNAGKFVQFAQVAMGQVLARGNVPILCGGAGLYFRALFEGLGTAPPANASLRAELEGQPLERLLVDLAKMDPEMFQMIDRKNPRRVIRALEVIRQTQRPFSSQRTQWRNEASQGIVPVSAAGNNAHALFIGLRRASADLRRRINQRVDQMFVRGLVEETKRLQEARLAGNHPAMQAIGYRQIIEHLTGARPLAETMTLVKTRTCQFAKRQMTWFRQQAPLLWLSLAPEEHPAQTAALLAEAYRSGPGAIKPFLYSTFEFPLAGAHTTSS
jgi:tRNA dimethylallyltransferase